LPINVNFIKTLTVVETRWDFWAYTRMYAINCAHTSCR